MRETSKAGKHKSKSKQGRRKERGFVVFAFFLALLALVFFVFVFLPSFWLWWLLNGPLHPFGPCNSNSFCRAVSHRPLDCSSQPFFWWFVDFSCFPPSRSLTPIALPHPGNKEKLQQQQQHQQQQRGKRRAYCCHVARCCWRGKATTIPVGGDGGGVAVQHTACLCS